MSDVLSQRLGITENQPDNTVSVETTNGEAKTELTADQLDEVNGGLGKINWGHVGIGSTVGGAIGSGFGGVGAPVGALVGAVVAIVNDVLM